MWPGHEACSTGRCPEGSHCPSAGVVLPCPAGRYCPAGTYDGGIECPAEGAVRNNQPPLYAYRVFCPEGSRKLTHCPEGSHCPNVTVALPCPAGHFCREGANESMPSLAKVSANMASIWAHCRARRQT